MFHALSGIGIDLFPGVSLDWGFHSLCVVCEALSCSFEGVCKRRVGVDNCIVGIVGVLIECRIEWRRSWPAVVAYVLVSTKPVLFIQDFSWLPLPSCNIFWRGESTCSNQQLINVCPFSPVIEAFYKNFRALLELCCWLNSESNWVKVWQQVKAECLIVEPVINFKSCSSDEFCKLVGQSVPEQFLQVKLGKPCSWLDCLVAPWMLVMRHYCKNLSLLIVLCSLRLKFPVEISTNAEIIVLVFKEAPWTIISHNSRVTHDKVARVDLFFNDVWLTSCHRFKCQER